MPPFVVLIASAPSWQVSGANPTAAPGAKLTPHLCGWNPSPCERGRA